MGGCPKVWCVCRRIPLYTVVKVDVSWSFPIFSDSLASTSDTALSLIKKPALHQER